jgi:threonine dehydrogenase-like Zn-dependent dehydrogenase
MVLVFGHLTFLRPCRGRRLLRVAERKHCGKILCRCALHHDVPPRNPCRVGAQADTPRARAVRICSRHRGRLGRIVRGAGRNDQSAAIREHLQVVPRERLHPAGNDRMRQLGPVILSLPKHQDIGRPAERKVSSGDFVLITAASSSVGLAAIQIVKAEGGVSIATTRTAAKKEHLLALGADHVIVTDTEDLVARVQEITGGKGARVVFDPVGGDFINTLGQATANGGSIFLYGMLSGKPTPFPMSTFGRSVAMYGYTFGELRNTPAWDVMKKYIYDHLADGSFKPEIARTFPFHQSVEAYRYLESNEQIGKVVITL